MRSIKHQWLELVQEKTTGKDDVVIIQLVVLWILNIALFFIISLR